MPSPKKIIWGQILFSHTVLTFFARMLLHVRAPFIHFDRSAVYGLGPLFLVQMLLFFHFLVVPREIRAESPLVRSSAKGKGEKKRVRLRLRCARKNLKLKKRRNIGYLERKNETIFPGERQSSINCTKKRGCYNFFIIRRTWRQDRWRSKGSKFGCAAVRCNGCTDWQIDRPIDGRDRKKIIFTFTVKNISIILRIVKSLLRVKDTSLQFHWKK